jgi:cysteine sulfinate desulfinase/cysteine desulfurase-like protein
LFKNVTYLDYNSTIPTDSMGVEPILPFLNDNFANSSIPHHFGQRVNEKVKQVRELIADFINAEPNELIFTSGATESINTALKGIAENYSAKGNHIVTVSTEHYAVLDSCKHLETKGYEITYLPVSREGRIDLDELKNSLRTGTILVCLMYLNNETVIIQPIKEIAQIEMKKDSERVSALRDELENEILKISGSFVNGSRENRIYNTTNICFKRQDANVLMWRMKNIAVSNGSACSFAVVEPSHVLKAMGLNDDDGFGSIRFSLGKYNKSKEFLDMIKELNTVCNEISLK